MLTLSLMYIWLSYSPKAKSPKPKARTCGAAAFDLELRAFGV